MLDEALDDYQDESLYHYQKIVPADPRRLHVPVIVLPRPFLGYVYGTLPNVPPNPI